jgi:hypothetical protein
LSLYACLDASLIMKKVVIWNEVKAFLLLIDQT